MPSHVQAWLVIVIVATTVTAQSPPLGKTRYLRPTGDGWTRECEFEVRRQGAGWAIGSTTDRGKTKMIVQAAYDEENQLRSGEVVLKDDQGDRAAILKRRMDKVEVHRGGQDPQAFDAPPGVIVTSAPDWTDVFLLCRRYRHAEGGKQTFAALWVHPDQPTQLLKLTIERKGYDSIRHDGEVVKLARVTIQLRGNSDYVAWATLDGTTVRLIPLPWNKSQRSGLILDGYDQSGARDLAPPP